MEGVKRTTGGQSYDAAIINDPVSGTPVMLRTNTGMQSLYVNDGTTGSPIALITADGYQAFGYDYDPFGVPTLTQDSGGAGTTENPYTFASTGVHDRTTGWVRFGYRSYAPVTGTFTQQDTLDAPLDPFNANRYAYAGNDPINNIDPTGQAFCAKSIATGTAGGFVGGAVTGVFTGPGVLATATVGAAAGGAAGATECAVGKLYDSVGVGD